MDFKDLISQLDLNEKKENFEEVVEILEKIRSFIRKKIYESSNENERNTLEKSFKLYTIKLYETKKKVAKTSNDKLYYSGKTIKVLKEYYKGSSGFEKNYVRDKIDKEMISHKDISKEIRLSGKKEIKIDKKVGLKVQEISDSIKLFLSKHDLINKFKESCKSAVFGGATTIGFEALLTLLMGGGITASFLINSLPIVGLIGISSLVRNLITKSNYQNFAFKNSKEYEELVKKIPVEFKEEFTSIKSLLEEKKNLNDYDKTTINVKLIKIYDKIIDNTKVDELKKAFKVEKQNLLLENKKIYGDMIDKHIKDQAILSKSKYQEIVKSNLKNDILIFENENSIKEAGKEAVKKSGIDVVTLLVSRIIAGAIIPGYAFKSITDLLVPLGFMLSNNLISIVNYKNKLINSKYNNKKIKLNNKEKFEELAKVNNNELKLATI